MIQCKLSSLLNKFVLGHLGYLGQQLNEIKNVSFRHTFLVEELQREGQLLDDVARLLLRELHAVLDVVEQLAWEQKRKH